VAMVGNGLVIVAVARTTALRRVSMFFVASLAASDFILGFVMNSIYFLYLFFYEHHEDVLPDQFYVKLIKAENYFWVQTVASTTFNLCAVSIDRLVAIVRPLIYQQVMTEKRCCVAITFIWCFSAI
ncbi:predicted protein, partial [Nematostella vectensis]